MKKIIGILFTVLFSQQIISQNVEWNVFLEKNEITLGDQIWVKFSVIKPGNIFITFSLEGNSEKNKIEILNTKTDTIYEKDSSIAAVNEIVTISAYHPGDYTIIPAIACFYSNDTMFQKEEGRPMILTVKTIEIDSTQDIHDIETIQKEPVHFSEIFPFILGCVIIAGLIFAGIYIRRRYKNKEPLFKIFARPAVPYYQTVLENLEGLRRKSLWQSGRIKEYYTELIDIFKFYINGRYHIQAAEMTSDELTRALSSNHEFSKIFLPNIQYVLTNSDMVKFAKSLPLPDEHDRAFQIILDFVKQTMPVETETRQEENKK